MPYRRSTYRKDFDVRISALLAQARIAERRSKSISHDHRDMIFQCAIFQTSAAMETYNRLILEGWMQKLRTKSLSEAPLDARAFVLADRLKLVFEKFSFFKDEGWLLSELSKTHWPWNLMTASGEFPAGLTGAALHMHISYPSEKNIEKLYGRVGIPKMIARVSTILKRDASILITSFQSVRTALAHSSPPEISIFDVTRLLADSGHLVAAIDRILFKHVQKHGGSDCWP